MLISSISCAWRVGAGLALGVLAGAPDHRAAATSVLPLPGNVATPPAAAPTSEFSAASIAASRAALKKEIATTRAQLAALPEIGSDESARWLTQETALLERLDAVHAEQQRTVQQAADLAKESAEIGERTRNRRPVETTFQPPLSLALLDQLYAERDDLEQSAGWLKTEVSGAETLLQEARDTLQEKERARRAVRQAIDKVAEPGGTHPGNLRLAELEGRLAQETVLLREHGLRTLKLQQSLLEPKGKLLAPRFAWLRAHLIIEPEELVAKPSPEPKRLAALAGALRDATKEADKVTQVAIVTERRGTEQKNAEELESRRADRQTANLTVSVLTAQRERLAEAAKVDGMRRQVLAGGVPAAELRTLAKENQEALDELARERRRAGLDLFRSRNEFQEWQGRLTRATAAGETSPAWAVERVKRLAAWIELSAAERADIDRIRTARSRLQEEIGGQVSLFSWRDQQAAIGESLLAAWNYEVFSVKDQPVRIKTILTVLLLVGLGYHASRWLSALLSRTLFKRLGLSPGRRAAWQVLWFYALFLVVLVVAFHLFHISLTQFSVVSGALAVGIGFGSQNLVGNFISGIILLIERPVNQGDVIEIDGQQVTVQEVGPRSTIVRSMDNTHIIVPNSRLLEQPVTNWTLSDDVIRKRISVGVAYDSPTRQVAALIQQVIAGVAAIRKEPAPIVKFSDFGASALVFEVYFWVDIADWWAAESELRHRIAEILAAENIVMAFPQRDVHLSTTQPLQVVIQQAQDGAAAKSG